MYSELIVENFSNPTHNGTLENYSVLLENKNPVCGDHITITLATDQNTITQAKFQAWGCATSIASANIFCNWIEGKNIAELKSMTRTQLEALLGELAPEQYHCLDILANLLNQFETTGAA